MMNDHPKTLKRKNNNSTKASYFHCLILVNTVNHVNHHHGGNKIMSYTNWLIVKNKLKGTFQVIVPWSVLNISTTDLNDMEAYIVPPHIKTFIKQTPES